MCQQLDAWATNCNVSTDGQIPDCSAWGAGEECLANCFVASSCADFQAASAGTENQLTACMVDCITGGPNPSLPTPTPTPSTGFLVAEGGYVTSGSWQGFAWTATDNTSTSTIQPADFSASLGGGALCASGTVAGTADYSAVAMLGINLNQPNVDPAPDPAPWTPTASHAGVRYQIVNSGGSPLRIQLQAPGGDTNADARFCAEISGTSGNLSWLSFNTACWDDSGLYYNGTTPLESIMVLVPGGTAPRSFDFCIQSLSVL